ncbi:hypothetical protein J2T17_007170 [Paenibacillus mucilaginosus]|uniref:hypothetical protein n=1 Tax=Paenibacillus mucilaginosus TaxID=61624 RepID=UPI003D209B56
MSMVALCVFISACGSSDKLVVNTPPKEQKEVVSSGPISSSTTPSEDTSKELEWMDKCPPFIDDSNYNKADHSSNKKDEGPVEMTEKVELNGYVIQLPEGWGVDEQIKGQLVHLKINKEEAGVIELFGPTEEFIPLNISKNDDVVKCNELSIDGATAIKLLLFRTPSAGDTSGEKPHDRLEYYVISKEGRINKLLRINLDLRKVSVTAAENIFNKLEMQQD